MSYDFNMASLADHLKKQSEQGSSTYYNIDIIKYEVRRAKSERQHGQVVKALSFKSGDSKFSPALTTIRIWFISSAALRIHIANWFASCQLGFLTCKACFQ